MSDENESEDEAAPVSKGLFWLLILGVALILAGIMVFVLVSLFFSGSMSTGVVVFIGPFPIVFGSGPNAAWLILIGIILAVLSVLLFWGMNKRRKLL